MKCQRKGTNKKIADRLKSHDEWMAYFQAGGYTREAASRLAFEKVKAGEVLSSREATLALSRGH